MVDEARARLLATAFRAALLLRHYTETRHIYGNLPDRGKALALHESLVAYLDGALADLPLPFDWKAERPHFENTADQTIANKFQPVIFILLAGELGYGPENLDKVEEYQRNNVLPPIPAIEERIQDILAFECRAPLARAGAEYVSRERAMFMLGHYWDFYRSLLQRHGAAQGCVSPHPLLRFIVNAKARIKACLATLADDALTHAVSEALEIPFNVDTLDVWDDWAQPIVARTTEVYEEARLSANLGGFALTQAEQLFLESGNQQAEILSARLDDEMRKLMAPQKKPRAPVESRERTCFEWIRVVERALRNVVLHEAQARVPAGWQRDVVYSLGDAADAARARMAQRGSSDEHLIHYTDLKDVHAVISGNYPRYAHAIGLRRKEFNALMAHVLKGRTEEAHNRPAHLWPKIEQNRVSVACNDVFNALKSPQSSDAASPSGSPPATERHSGP